MPRRFVRPPLERGHLPRAMLSSDTPTPPSQVKMGWEAARRFAYRMFQRMRRRCACPRCQARMCSAQCRVPPENNAQLEHQIGVEEWSGLACVRCGSERDDEVRACVRRDTGLLDGEGPMWTTWSAVLESEL